MSIPNPLGPIPTSPAAEHRRGMTLDRAVMAFAGLVVLTSAALTWWVHPLWILLAVFAGVNMLQASFTGFCPSAMAFKALGVKPGVVFR